MIVVDVGATRYGEDYSMERLIQQFEPCCLYAIDPNPALSLPEVQVAECDIFLINAAAWVRDGTIGFREDGLRSWVSPSIHGPQTACIDLGRFITELTELQDDNIVLKLDCEGAEYDLLNDLIIRDVDETLDLLLVEWHPRMIANGEALRRDIEGRLRCEVREWPY